MNRADCADLPEVTVKLAPYDIERAVLTFGGQPVRGFDRDDRVVAGSPPATCRITFTLRPDFPNTAAVLEEIHETAMPWPVLLRSRDRPARRRRARGGLRPMVRQRRRFVAHGADLVGRTSTGTTIKLHCTRKAKTWIDSLPEGDRHRVWYAPPGTSPMGGKTALVDKLVDSDGWPK